MNENKQIQYVLYDVYNFKKKVVVYNKKQSSLHS